MIHVCIKHEELNAQQLEGYVSTASNGAVVTFIGQVRNHARGREAAYLEYDAYVPMAELELRKIAEEAEIKWKADVAIEHRLGRLELTEASVIVCVGTAHRSDAFEACRFCIDTLKLSVPIWKKEVGPDGSFWIEGEEAIASK